MFALGKITSGRGKGPSYMKAPYIYPPFQTISSHSCTVFGVGGVQDWEGHVNVVICICTSVCIELELKNLILSSWGVKSVWKNLKFIV